MGTNNLDALVRRASRMAEKTFDEYGAIDLFWLLEKADGEQVTLLTPVRASSNDPSEASAIKEGIAKEVRKFCHEHDVRRYVQVFEAWVAAERQSKFRSSSDLPDDEGRVFLTMVPGAPFQVLGRRADSGELCIGSLFKPDGECVEQYKELEARGGEILRGKEAEELIAEVAWSQFGSLANHPRRSEAVVLSAEDGREHVAATRNIVRPPAGKPYLEKLSDIERPKGFKEGRFSDLLPRGGALQ